MTDKEIQKLSRKQLLKIMLQQSIRIDELESELDSVKKELESFKGDIRINAQSKYLIEQALAEAEKTVRDFFESKTDTTQNASE